MCGCFLRGKKSEIPGPSPQDLGIPIGQISSPSYASRTLAPSSQSMHSQNSRARSRSLSYDSSRSVRARPATAPAPTANSAVAAAIPAPDLMLATKLLLMLWTTAPGSAPRRKAAPPMPALPRPAALPGAGQEQVRLARAGRHGAAHQAAQAEPLHGDPSPESNPSPNPNPNPNFNLNLKLNPNRAPSASSRSSRPCLATRAPPPCRTSFRAP